MNKKKGKYLLQLLNYSGFNGTTFFDPLPIYGIKIRLMRDGAKEEVLKSKTGEICKKEVEEFEVSLTGLYKHIVINR